MTAGPGDIAIVGMAGRFPGAADVGEYWSNVSSGRISIRALERADLLAAGVPAAELDDPAYVPARGVLADVEMFDAAFFGIVPTEAAIMDPQHRLLLQTAWEALESGGLITAGSPGRIGTFAGAGFNYYLLRNILATPGIVRDHGLLAVALGNEKDHLAAKVAYRLNLSGPAVTVQTACSTSLVAVHLACQSLRAGDSDVALAGGVCVAVPQPAGYLYEPKGIMSPDGTCRPFDARAAGTVPGNGVAVVALKRAADAARDGDIVYAVIKGSAINNDAGAKVGYTAPGIGGQVDVLRRAYANAGVDPATVGYLEAHGTATEVGDEIELAALAEVFGKRGPGARPCSLGSVKANVGHLDAAAGVAGLIKVALALHFRRTPPLAGLAEPRGEFDEDSFPFTLDPAGRPWTVDAGAVRRGAVSSFGLGGTNAHVVLEEAARPARTPITGERPALLTLSGRTAEDLAAARGRLAAGLSAPLHDVALTLQSHRRHFKHRQAVVARDAAEAVRELSRAGGRTAARRPSLVFLFPGQGAEFPGMAAAAYAAHSSVRADVDLAAGILAPLIGLDIRDVLLDGAAPEDLVHRTDVAQPALLVHEYALGRLLTSWGLRPAALLGHSIGEYAAACLAQEISFPAALRLVARRGALMREAPPGGMLVVFAAEDAVRPHLREIGDLDVAAVNGPRAVVVAGPVGALDDLRGRLDAAAVMHRALPARRAFHSRMMAAAAAEFGRFAATAEMRDRHVDVIDARTGDLLARGGHRDTGAWAEQLRSPVRFDRAARTALALPRPVFLEVGPGRALTGAVRQAEEAAAVVAVAAQPDRRVDAEAALAAAVGDLWTAGVDVDWAAFRAPVAARRVALPTYPFARTTHWLAAGERTAGEAVAAREPEPAAGDTALDRVLGIWRDLLGTPGVTADSNFFDLGGESLLFLRMIARVRRAFGVPIDVAAVSRRPTPGALVESLGAAPGRG